MRLKSNNVRQCQVAVRAIHPVMKAHQAPPITRVLLPPLQPPVETRKSFVRLSKQIVENGIAPEVANAECATETDLWMALMGKVQTAINVHCVTAVAYVSTATAADMDDALHNPDVCWIYCLR